MHRRQEFGIHAAVADSSPALAEWFSHQPALSVMCNSNFHTDQPNGVLNLGPDFRIERSRFPFCLCYRGLEAVSYAPELNPVERVWLFLRERHLSHRLHEGYTAIVDAVSAAWCQLTPQRLRSLCAYPWIEQVSK